MSDIASMRRAEEKWRGTSLATPLILFHLTASEVEFAETRFRASVQRLCSYEPSTASAAASVLEEIVRTATEQSERWGHLRLQSLAELGLYLRRHPCRQGRPPKVSTADSLPSLEELGLTDRRIAHRARLVASIPEKLRRAYVMETEQPTERGLHRYAEEKQRLLVPQPSLPSQPPQPPQPPRYWITPP